MNFKRIAPPPPTFPFVWRSVENYKKLNIKIKILRYMYYVRNRSRIRISKSRGSLDKTN